MVDRASEVEQQIARYGLTTVSALSASVFAGLSGKAAERVMTRSLAEGRVRSQPLVGRKCFYTLSPEAAREHGLAGDRSGLAMGAQAVLQNYAMLAYCLLGQPRHERLTRPEFIEKFPELAQPGILGPAYRTRYYLDKSERDQGVVRLALMIPDLGSHPRRLVRKARREIEKRKAAHPEVARMIQDRVFSATVLTAFPAKAERIRQALAQDPFHSRVAVVAGYDELMTYCRQGSHDDKS